MKIGDRVRIVSNICAGNEYVGEYHKITNISLNNKGYYLNNIPYIFLENELILVDRKLKLERILK